MNGSVFIIALLLYKEVITKKEALKLQVAITTNITNTNLKDMLDQIAKLLDSKEEDTAFKRIDARDL